MKRTQNQKGYTLIESIMFIGVITAVSISIINVVSSMLDKYKISRLTSQVAEFQKIINVRFAASESYSKLNTSTIHQEKLYPADVNWEGTKMLHKYNGEIKAKSVLGGRGYEIQFLGLPKKPCVDLAIQNWAHDQYSNLIHMKVNGTIAKWRNAVYIMPLSVVQAETLCSKELDNEITWRFQ